MSAPVASHDAPTAPNLAASAQAPAPPVAPAAPTGGVVQTQPAPAPKRARVPRGPIPFSGAPKTEGAPALLEISAAVPMYTVQRRSVNYFVPNFQFMFWILSLCDNMMLSTHRFTQSAPAWLPIVSQLYISVLVWYQILRIYVHTGYGIQFADYVRNMEQVLRLDECLVPGPLVPFLESLAATNGPFDWIGDIIAAIPNFDDLWQPTFHIPNEQQLHYLPWPVVLLDQLVNFATWVPTAPQTVYGHFRWYHNVFSVASSLNTNRYRRYLLSPPGAGSLFCTESQTNAARGYWNTLFSTFDRVGSATNNIRMNNVLQIIGFQTTTGAAQADWFQYVAIVMQKYGMYFNGSKQLKAISPVGLGASMVHGTLDVSANASDWLYPANYPGPFFTNRFAPPHEIPSELRFSFGHSDHELEEVAEQYQLLTSTNVSFSSVPTQHGRTQLTDALTRVGDYWTMLQHRQIDDINFKHQFAQLIASRYHQSVALKAD